MGSVQLIPDEDTVENDAKRQKINEQRFIGRHRQDSFLWSKMRQELESTVPTSLKAGECVEDPEKSSKTLAQSSAASANHADKIQLDRSQTDFNLNDSSQQCSNEVRSENVDHAPEDDESSQIAIEEDKMDQKCEIKNRKKYKALPCSPAARAAEQIFTFLAGVLVGHVILSGEYSYSDLMEKCHSIVEATIPLTVPGVSAAFWSAQEWTVDKIYSIWDNWWFRMVFRQW
jgi:hypothetical protein